VVVKINLGDGAIAVRSFSTRFMKIRHYRLLGNGNRTKKLIICKTLTNTPIIEKVKISAVSLIEKILGKRAFQCPCCNSDVWFATLVLRRQGDKLNTFNQPRYNRVGERGNYIYFI